MTSGALTMVGPPRKETTMNLTYCFTQDEGKYNEARIGHVGPHQVGLGLTQAGLPFGGGHDGRWVLERAIELAEGYEDDRDDDIALVQPLLTRPEIRQYFIDVTDEELAALKRLLFEAEDYWIVNNYASDEGEDAILGHLAEGHFVTTIGQCIDVKFVQMPKAGAS